MKIQLYRDFTCCDKDSNVKPPKKLEVYDVNQKV